MNGLNSAKTKVAGILCVPEDEGGLGLKTLIWFIGIGQPFLDTSGLFGLVW